MATEWTAISVEPNHEWDFQADADGTVTALFIRGNVTYQCAAEERTWNEKRDVWPELSGEQQAQIQARYSASRTWFNDQFLG